MNRIIRAFKQLLKLLRRKPARQIPPVVAKRPHIPEGYEVYGFHPRKIRGMKRSTHSTAYQNKLWNPKATPENEDKKHRSR